MPPRLCGSDWFTAADIALALGTNKKKIHRTAEREKWPTRQVNNRLEYQPPDRIAEIVIGSPLPSDGRGARGEGPTVRFSDLVAGDAQREAVLLREQAVQLLANNLHLGKQLAVALVCKHFATSHPLFPISARSLRRWGSRYAQAGLDGLVEQKRRRSGRKPFSLDLDASDILRTAAAAVDHGHAKGGPAHARLNIARAYRNLVADPTVAGPARQWLHGDHPAKSYVPPSVRAAVKQAAPESTVTLLQIGPKAMRDSGPYTECSYANVRPGQAFTADDMTANTYVWVEWPNERGYLLIRPQVLSVMDIGSLCWLNIRAVIRPKGQYTKDDVWGLIGDTFDKYGKFDIAVLEGGTWQSNVIRGHKTGIDDDTRFGGLRALGVKLIHTRTPRGKIIETEFNQLQHAADNCVGYCGRDERRDCPEHVKKWLAACESGKAHPRQFFMHLNQYTEHLAGVMRSLNNERNDGKVLRGETPFDKWSTVFGEEVGRGRPGPPRQFIPDSAKWMYRSSYNVVAITRNGVRITQGTGKYQQAYSYDAPELQANKGSRVVVYWNDYDPDTAAVIYTIRNGKPHEFLCVASRVSDLPRFGATQEQMASEAARKKLAHNLAVTKSAAIAPYLQRPAPPAVAREAGSGASPARTSAIGDRGIPDAAPTISDRINQVRAEADQVKAAGARRRAAVRSAKVTEDDRAAASGLGDRAEQTSAEEISDLFSSP